MTLTEQVTKNIIRKLIKSEDHRMDVVSIINAEFLQFAVDFFKKIVNAKLNNKDISSDWYKSVFLKHNLPSSEFAINSGLNKKTIHNMFNSSTKEIVINASEKHYELLYEIIENLIETEPELELMITIKFKNVSVELNISESLIVINTLAVKRAELRGGAWSTTGKQVEKSLMLTLCKLYNVPSANIETKFVRDRSKNVDREVDFYLINGTEKYRCEVKLMGRGNPESADAIFARNPKIFVADKLSTQNKHQIDEFGTFWVELHAPNGYMRFGEILKILGIPYMPFSGNIDEALNRILV